MLYLLFISTRIELRVKKAGGHRSREPSFGEVRFSYSENSKISCSKLKKMVCLKCLIPVVVVSKTFVMFV